VRFYMRSPHYEACREAGLNVTSIDGDLRIPPNEIELYDDVHDMARLSSPAAVANDNNRNKGNGNSIDWVIVCLKSTSLDAIPDLLYPLLNEDNTTRVLVIMNGLVEDDLIRMMKMKAGQSDSEGGEDDDSPLECCRALYGGKKRLN